MENIDSVVFDLGGVVIDLERQRCIEAFRRLGYDAIEADLDLYVQRGAFFGLECGHITAADFFDRMRALCPGARCDLDIQQAFNAFLVRLPEERLDALLALRKSKRVFALSNTNPVMYHSWIDHAFRTRGLAINDYFEGIIASFQEGCCKPDPEIFHILLRRYSLTPERTLYLDDSEANCRAAEACGLRTVCVDERHSMLHVVKSLMEDDE